MQVKWENKNIGRNHYHCEDSFAIIIGCKTEKKSPEKTNFSSNK